jgi:pilus assembly protein CpaC
MAMLNRIKQSVVLASVGVSLCAVQAQAETLVVPVGRSQLVNVSADMSEVIVANPEIADAYVHDKRKLSVMGKKIGITDVRVLGESGVLRDVTINVGYDLPAIRKALKEYLPHEQVGVEMLNTNIVLTGQVSNADAAQRAVKIVNEYVSPSVGSGGDGGEKKDSTDDVKILNLLEVTSGQQVMLRVRVGEIKRTALKNLGINLQAVKAGGDTLFALGTGGGIAGLTANSGVPVGQFALPNDVRGVSSIGLRNSSGNSISAMLEALERDKLFKVLAEPNLVSLSGEKSEFLAGGEFPIPVPQQNGAITIEYKPFGVSVKFTPFVLAENRIRIAVEPEVSEINTEGALEVQGYIIPSLTTRRAQTVVELSPGESFMIAGLIQDKLTSSIESLPGAKEIPILGALFSSVSFNREETELVLAVTPYIVDPVVSADIKLPTDDLRPASTMEMFFYGAIGSLHGNIDRLSQTPTTEGPVGYMVD